MVGAGAGGTVLEDLAASDCRQGVELERKVLVQRADPRIADVRHSRRVRFPVRQPVCPFSRACARVAGHIGGGHPGADGGSCLASNNVAVAAVVTVGPVPPAWADPFTTRLGNWTLRAGRRQG